MKYYTKEIESFKAKEIEIQGSYNPENFLVLIGEFNYYDLKTQHLLHDRGDGTEAFEGLTIKIIQDADCFHIIHKDLCKLFLHTYLSDFFSSPVGISYARDVVEEEDKRLYLS